MTDIPKVDVARWSRHIRHTRPYPAKLKQNFNIINHSLITPFKKLTRITLSNSVISNPSQSTTGLRILFKFSKLTATALNFISVGRMTKSSSDLNWLNFLRQFNIYKLSQGSIVLPKEHSLNTISIYRKKESILNKYKFFLIVKESLLSDLSNR